MTFLEKYDILKIWGSCNLIKCLPAILYLVHSIIVYFIEIYMKIGLFISFFSHFTHYCCI